VRIILIFWGPDCKCFHPSNHLLEQENNMLVSPIVHVNNSRQPQTRDGDTTVSLCQARSRRNAVISLDRFLVNSSLTVKSHEGEAHHRTQAAQPTSVAHCDNAANLHSFFASPHHNSASSRNSKQTLVKRNALAQLVMGWLRDLLPSPAVENYPLNDYLGYIDKQTLYDQSCLPVYPPPASSRPSEPSKLWGNKLGLPPSYQLAMTHPSLETIPSFDPETVWIVNPEYVDLLVESLDFGRVHGAKNHRARQFSRSPLVSPEACGISSQVFQQLSDAEKTPSSLWKQFVTLRLAPHMFAIPRYTNESDVLFDPSLPFPNETAKCVPNAPVARLLPVFQAHMKQLVRSFWMDQMDRTGLAPRPVDLENYIQPGIDLRRRRDDRKRLIKRLARRLDLFVLVQVEHGAFIQSQHANITSLLRDYY